MMKFIVAIIRQGINILTTATVSWTLFWDKVFWGRLFANFIGGGILQIMGLFLGTLHEGLCVRRAPRNHEAGILSPKPWVNPPPSNGYHKVLL